jgi:tetratricopeptide (TPR) repeat protein
MKSERRHELHSNILADQLSDLLEYLRTRGQFIVFVAVGVIAVVAIVWIWQWSAETRRMEGWQTMKTLLATSREADPEVLGRMEQVAADYSDGKLQAMAYAQLGKRLMQEAVLTGDAAEAREFTQRAEAAFRAALESSDEAGTPAAIAQLGLGGIAANRGDLEEAKQYFEAVGNDPAYEGTPYVALAAEQLTVLERARDLPPLAPGTQPAATAGSSATQPANG